jgi:hydrogenase-4 component J
MSTTVAVYQLSHKFVNQRQDIPENARQVVYYALAVGHHVGVMDCFSSLAEIPYDEFSTWVTSLPDGVGRAKLAGVMKWGEIEINRSHVELLLPLFESHPAETSWTPLLAGCLRAMLQEPALYFMLRRRQ